MLREPRDGDMERLDEAAGAFLLSLLVLGCLLLVRALCRDRIPGARFERGRTREVALWHGGEVALVFFVYIVAAATAGELVVAVDEGSKTVQVLLVGSLVGAIACAFIFWTVRVVRGQSLSALGFVRSPLRNVVPVVVLLVASYLPLGVVNWLWLQLLEAILGEAPPQQEAVRLAQEAGLGGDPLDVASIWLMAVVVAPVTEEVIFRGFLHGLLRDRYGFWWGAVISAVFFSLLHPPAVLPIFCVGLILSFVYERTGSLPYSMLFHALFNGVQLVTLFARTGV